MKRLLVPILALLLLGASAKADSIPEYPQLYAGPINAGKGVVSYVSIEGSTNIYRSALTGRVIQNNNLTNIGTCKSLSDGICASANRFNYQAVLSACDSTINIDCISGVDAIDSNNQTLSGTLSPTFLSTKDGSYTGDPGKNLPSGGQAPLVEIPGAPHAFGTKYLAVVRILGNGNENGNMFMQELFIRLYAIKVIQGTYNFNKDIIDLNTRNYAGSPNMNHDLGGDPKCVVNDNTQCAVPTDLPADKKFRISIRTSIAIPGWMHGKVANPEIKIEKISNGYQTTITANPIVNPVLLVQKNVSELGSEFTKPYANNQTSSASDCDRSSIPYDLAKCTYTVLVGGYDQQDFDEFMKWLPISDNTAFIEPTIWNFIVDSQTKTVGNCQIPDNQIGGIVSTNATMYLSGPPTWDSNAKTLDYKVAAPHFLSNKTVFQGSYDLAIDSKLARCIYKFTNAPISATVSIQSSDGSTQVATTIVKEANGFLYLFAKGFTFSSPVLSVKLIGEPIPEPVVQPTPTPSPTETSQSSVTPTSQQTPKVVVTKKPVVVKSITCISGKVSKVFKGSACPKGWKPKK